MGEAADDALDAAEAIQEEWDMLVWAVKDRCKTRQRCTFVYYDDDVHEGIRCTHCGEIATL